ncbi:unnamed protein product, partial [Heterosigma akashiwo]
MCGILLHYCRICQFYIQFQFCHPKGDVLGDVFLCCAPCSPKEQRFIPHGSSGSLNSIVTSLNGPRGAYHQASIIFFSDSIILLFFCFATLASLFYCYQSVITSSVKLFLSRRNTFTTASSFNTTVPGTSRIYIT